MIVSNFLQANSLFCKKSVKIHLYFFTNKTIFPSDFVKLGTIIHIKGLISPTVQQKLLNFMCTSFPKCTKSQIYFSEKYMNEIYKTIKKSSKKSKRCSLLTLNLKISHFKQKVISLDSSIRIFIIFFFSLE